MSNLTGTHRGAQSPGDAAKIVGEALRKFIANMAEHGIQEQHILFVLFNASIRLLISAGLKPKDLKRLLGESLGVIRRHG